MYSAAVRDETPYPIIWGRCLRVCRGQRACQRVVLDVARIRRYCAARVPDRALHQVRVECVVAVRHVTIVERRVPFRGKPGDDWTSFPIARLRWSAPTKEWELFYRAASAGSRVGRRVWVRPMPPARGTWRETG